MHLLPLPGRVQTRRLSRISNQNQLRASGASHIPSSAQQSSSSFSNNIQSSGSSLLRGSMFLWPGPRGSCHRSPACAQGTAAETHSESGWRRSRLGNQCGTHGAGSTIWDLGGRFCEHDWQRTRAMGWAAEPRTYHGAAAWNLGAQVFPLHGREWSRAAAPPWHTPDPGDCGGGSVSEELAVSGAVTPPWRDAKTRRTISMASNASHVSDYLAGLFQLFQLTSCFAHVLHKSTTQHADMQGTCSTNSCFTIFTPLNTAPIVGSSSSSPPCVYFYSRCGGTQRQTFVSVFMSVGIFKFTQKFKTFTCNCTWVVHA